MTTTPPIIASFYTLAGEAELTLLGGTEISPHDLRDRIRVAGEAGYTGFGFADHDLRYWADRVGINAIRSELDNAGIDVVEIEALFDWWATGPIRAESDALRAEMLQWSVDLNARHIKVGTSLHGLEAEHAQLVDGLAGLAADFAEIDVLVGLEPMAVAQLKTPDAALAVVEDAGAPNAGIVIDTWHIVRAHTPFDHLARIDPTRIVTIELNDMALEPVGGDLINDGANHRRFPGEGEQDLEAFVRAILSTGYDGPWGNENLSIEARGMDLRQAAAKGYSTVVEVVTGVRP